MKRIFDFNRFCENLQAHCALTSTKKFKKDEVITTYLLKRNQICILLSGEAFLIRYTDGGQRHILCTFKKGDAFGETFYRLHTSKELFVLAKKDSEVLFLPYDKLDSCNKECTYHLQLLRELPDLFLNRMTEMNLRTELLACHTIREKLLAYFFSVKKEKGSSSFELPLSLTDLADYLVIDRSAMMREISKMKQENIIMKKGKTFKIIHQNEMEK